MSIRNGTYHCTILVDHATQFIWIYHVKSLPHDAIKAIFSGWSVDTGAFQKHLYTNFDSWWSHFCLYLQENSLLLQGSPSHQQNQNGLVECAWQKILNMECAFITYKQMPHQYRHWTWQSVQVLNRIPCTVEGISTTPHELVYGVKPVFFYFLNGIFSPSLWW